MRIRSDLSNFFLLFIVYMGISFNLCVCVNVCVCERERAYVLEQLDKDMILWQKDQISLGCVCACSVIQSCPTLCDHMDYSLPGFSVHGVLQSRILE